MQLARVYIDHLTVIAACRPAFEDGFVVSNHDETGQQATPDTPIAAPGGVTVKNTTLPLSPSKREVLKISNRGEGGPLFQSRAAQLPAPNQATPVTRSSYILQDWKQP